MPVALDEPEQMRLDEQEPLHHDRARHSLEPARRLDREDVAVVEEIGDLVRAAGDPVRDAVEPVLELSASKQTPAPELLAARQRNRRRRLAAPVRVDDLAGRRLERLEQAAEPPLDRRRGLRIDGRVELVMGAHELREGDSAVAVRPPVCGAVRCRSSVRGVRGHHVPP